MENRDEIILLTRVDRARNMARFYRLAIEPTLFGGLVLHRTWGRLGTWGQSRLVYCADLDTAHEHRARLTAQKLRKGYCPQ
ncbi:WGR domain-containing protein [Roseibium salinum]|uniref:WGR domain-containing protein n=1 Tax=Roseibium salinum TaxID=1604349 RepID=A0ABT3QWM0_9HYPH|nr:WGR domain-containing protein [Roseibium sp. DSM 29163]MCX2721265.1 WGR domain-containing protein [Roseibium sp. DSM 29163]